MNKTQKFIKTVKNYILDSSKDVKNRAFMVFIFLPLMFFTNGGAGGGAPLWLLLGMVYIMLILKGDQCAITNIRISSM
ncbi:MAG: hypothetical protein K6G03_06575 [Lachnospiraceae bacterium]|nr:hypothetical protein [Lachnospiraceae bacterium]